MEEFVCEARVRFRGKDLALNKIISRISLEDMMPPRGPVDPMSWQAIQGRQERRERFIDMMASEFAHALIEALYTVNAAR